MEVTLPDGKALTLPDGATGLDAARAIGPKLAEQAVLALVGGEPRDLRLPLSDGATIRFLTTRDTADADALRVLRHSAAHLLAEAVLRLHPDARTAIGPPIADGFYYDFEFAEPLREEELEAIQQELERILAEGRVWSREEISAADAVDRFAGEGQPYKVELVASAAGAISLYTQGGFTDLCRGPHLQTSAPIGAVKVTGMAGAYWRGDSANAQLTRIYATAFFTRRELDEHLERLEQARARDHRRLGPQLDLFHFDEHSPGSPFWHPKGMAVYGQLEEVRRRENARRGYSEVKTPLIYDKALWETSGHWEKFRENMFLIPGATESDPTYGIKPMNCPGHMLLYRSRLRSYRDLPIRYAEAAPLHRNELAGALHGLTRVRFVTQDDAHIFCTEDQVPAEIDAAIAYARHLYGLFEIEPRATLSTRPENRLGDDAQWDRAEAALRDALERHGMAFEEDAGGGAFYGPKIDLFMSDVLGRSWQTGTVQYDMLMPARFGLAYMGSDNREHTPIVIHRALFGSFERFLGILIEHFAGALPLWLAPVQVKVLPVAVDHRAAVEALGAKLREAGVRVEVDVREETLGRRIRDAELEKTPLVVVWGDRESEEALAIRRRGAGQETLTLGGLIAEVRAATPA